MRRLFEDIMYDRRRSPLTLPLRFFLRMLSIFFGVVMAWRNFLYDKNIIRAHQVPCRIVSIGNITVGGTGKTPLVVMTARMLREREVKVAVVSRGYGRVSGGTLVVSDGERILPPDQAGDEPHLIATALPGVPVVVGRDRVRAAMLAYEQFKPEVILLDDGFQHRRLYREVDIITMDACNPIGSEYLLPRGILRESPRGLKRAKAAVFTRLEETHDRERCKRMVHYYDRNIPVFWTRMQVTGLRDPVTGEMRDIASLAGKRVAALSNVANPASFHRLLETGGAQIVHRRVLPDHHRYTVRDITAIVREAREDGGEILVMTAKDERNLPPGWAVEGIVTRVLDFEAVLTENEGDYLSIVLPHSRKQ